nr:hypothetical protein [Staphylococcus epidermidis]
MPLVSWARRCVIRDRYDIIHCANHYFEQIKSGKIIEDIKIDHFNNYHNINFEDLNPSDFF